MALYPTLPDHPAPPITPTPRSINRARTLKRSTPAGSVRAGDGKICPIVYGRHFIRPYLGSVLYGRADAGLQQQYSLGLTWIFCVGEIEDFERIFLNDNFIFGSNPNATHGQTDYYSGTGAYNYFAMTPYFGKPGQPVDPILSGMAQITPNYSTPYTDTNIYTENGLLVPQAYIATAQNKMYDAELQVPTALVKGLKVYDPRGPVTAYSENPALHLADFLIADYGPRWKADWTSVADAADYCDELLDGKKRNRCGFIINGQAPINDIIERMRALAGVVVRKEGDNFYFVIDKPGLSVFTFDHTNIVANSFELAYRPLLDKPSQIEVEFTRARRNDNNILPPWLLDTVTYPGPGDPGYSADVDERRVARVELHDCQDIDVAVRFAKKLWFRQLDSKYRVRLTTKDMAAALYPGEIVTVDHEHIPKIDNPMEFMVRAISARHTQESLSYVVELEQYAPASYVDEPTTEPNPFPDLSEPPGGTSGATRLPLYCLEELAVDDSVLVNIEAFPDNYCGLADASTGIAAEGYVLKGEGSDYDNVEGAYIAQVNVNEGLMLDVGVAISKGRVYLGNAGQPAMSPPSDAVITQDVGTGEPSDRVLFHYGSPEEVTYRAYAPNVTEWYPNEMVQDSGWLMRCNRTTGDRPAPQPEGPVAWLVTGETFATASVAKRIVAGQKYSFTSALVGVTGYRFYAPYTDIAYSLTVWDYTDEANPRLLESVVVPSPASTGWTEIPSGAALLMGGGSELVVAIDYERQTPVSNFSHVWQYEGTSGASNPGDGKMTRASNHSALYVAEEDETGVNRASSLDTLVVNDTIKITETESASRYLDYRIIGTPTDNGTWRTFPVELVSSGSTVRSGKKVNFDGQHLGGPASADYVYDTNYWGLSEYAGQIKGFLSDTYGGVPGQFDDTLYGTDIKGTVYTVSPYWDVLAYSGASSATGGGVSEDAVLSVNSALPDANGNVEFVKLGVGEPAPAYELDVIGAAAPGIRIRSTDDTATSLETDAPRTGAGNKLFGISVNWNGNLVAQQNVISSAATTTFDGSVWLVKTATDGILEEGIRVQQKRVGVGDKIPTATLEVKASASLPMLRITEGTEGDVLEVDANGDTSVHRAFAATAGAAVSGPVSTLADQSTAIQNITGLARVDAVGSSSTYGNLQLRAMTSAGSQRSLFYGDGATGNTGVNTATPDARFHVHGGSDVTQVKVQAWGFEVRNLFEVVDSADAARFFCVSPAGNTGVGTASPGARLHVENTATDDSFRVDDQLNDTTPFIINNAGNTGVGTATPEKKLDVKGQALVTGLPIEAALTLSDGDTDATDTYGRLGGRHYTKNELPVAGMMISGQASSNAVSIGGGTSFMNAANWIEFFTASGSNTTTPTGTLRARIDGDGKMAIGDTLPTARLHVQGTGGDSLRVDESALPEPPLVVKDTGFVGAGTSAPLENLHVKTGSSGVTTALGGVDGAIIEGGSGRTAALLFFTPNNQRGGLYWSDPEAHNVASLLYNHATNQLRIRTNMADRITVDNAGRVGIGANITPTQLLEMASTGTPRLTVRRTNESLFGQANIDILMGSGTVSTSNVLAQIRALSTQVDPNPLQSGLDFFINMGDLTAIVLSLRPPGRVGINTESPHASTAMDIQSTVGGLAPPRMSTAQRDAISSPVPQMIYNTTTNTFDVYITGTGWRSISTA